MIELSGADDELPVELLEAPGGFLWWYVDLIDKNGDGLVVIWSFGLPFLPGYANAARSGRFQLPVQRPSLNISHYRAAKLDFYLLQEFDSREVSWHREAQQATWRFGESRLRSAKCGDQHQVQLDLRLDVPGMKWPAVVELEARGPAVCGQWESEITRFRPETKRSVHDWRPLLCMGEGQGFLATSQGRVSVSGRAYHDRNGGCVPLHDIGIDWWAWGRVATAEEEFVYFVLDDESGRRETVFLTVDARGVGRRLKRCRLGDEKMKKSLHGLRVWRSVTVYRDGDRWFDIRFDDLVDSGPFYARSIPRARDSRGRWHRGSAEFCDPQRIDLRRHRMLVQMRVHRRGGDNSMWLPLFSGPKKGRVRRLIRSLASGR